MVRPITGEKSYVCETRESMKAAELAGPQAELLAKNRHCGALG